MPGLADFFRAAIGGTTPRDQIRSAAAIADTVDAFAEEDAQVLLLEVLLPWAANVARHAARAWITRRRKCGFDGEPCPARPIAECRACGRPVCIGHAFVGADATIICWPCMRTGAANAKPWKPRRNGAPHVDDTAPRAEHKFDKTAWAYAILGVTEDAGDDEVQAAYRKACFENHPDRATDPVDAQSRAEKFKMIQLAMQLIKSQRGMP